MTYEVTGPFRTDTGPVVPSTVTIPVADDTYVRGGSYADQSYGWSGVLPLKYESNPRYRMMSFVAMDVGSLTGTVTNAVLRLTGRLVTAPASPAQVLGVRSTNWSGATMTWNNMPATDAVLGTFTVSSTTRSTHEVDVTSWVAARRAEGATRVAFCLSQADISRTYALLDADEATSGEPELVVTTASGPPPPPPPPPSPANLAPTASFTTAIDGLSVAFDGRGSSDPDGMIRSYSWSFGDGTTAAGPIASRTYATSGTYPVTLTVVDDDGASGNAAQNVTVSAPGAGVVAADDFTRTVSGGLGRATVGGEWSTSGSSSNFSVDGATARVVAPAPRSSRSATLAEVSSLDVGARVDLTFDKDPTGSGSYVSVVVRKVGSTEYRLRVRLTSTSRYRELMRVVNGAEAVLVSQKVDDVRYVAGTPVHLRFRATGSGSTSLKGRVWFGSDPEPATWSIEVTDAHSALQRPGGVGVHHYLSGSVTNAPIVMTVDDLIVVPSP